MLIYSVGPLQRIRRVSTLSSIQFSKLGGFDWKKRKGKSQEQKASVPLISNETWFTQLSRDTEYDFSEKLLKSISHNNRYKSFERFFSKTLNNYGDEIYQSKKEINLIRDKYNAVNETPMSLNEAKLKFISKSLKNNDDSLIIHERLKTERLNAPFYIHQQFQLNLVSNNIRELIKLYFELPKPRVKHLKRNELEKFLSLITKMKFQHNHKALIPQIIKVLEDILYNGHGIKLTKIEKTKYFLLCTMNMSAKANAEGCKDQQRNFQKLKTIRTNLGLNETCEAWTILSSFFPQYNVDINKEMSHYIGLNRLVLPLILKSTTSWDQLQNVLEIIDGKNIHIDHELINLILNEYLRFGKYSDVSKIIKNLVLQFSKFKSASYHQCSIKSIKTQRIEREKYNIVNLARNSLVSYRKQNNERLKFENKLVVYPILPSSFLIGNLLTSMPSGMDSEILEMALLIKIHQLPLSYNHIYQMVSNTKDMDVLRTILEIILNTESENPQINSYIQRFNDKLSKIESDSRYDLHLRNQFSGGDKDQHIDERVWLIKILKKSIETHDEIVSYSKESNLDYLVQQRVQSLIVDLNDILNH